MALVVEDGTGLATADAYVSVADADSYLADYGTPTAWSSATTTDKEEAIRRATRALDAEFGAVWRGVRLTRDQALDWPRTDAEDRDGYVLPAVPQVLRDACAIVAAEDLAGNPLVQNQTVADLGIEEETVQVGSLRKSVRYRAGKPSGKVLTLVEDMLSDLIEPIYGVSRG